VEFVILLLAPGSSAGPPMMGLGFEPERQNSSQSACSFENLRRLYRIVVDVGCGMGDPEGMSRTAFPDVEAATSADLGVGPSVVNCSRSSAVRDSR
jgi:hypothetical protein